MRKNTIIAILIIIIILLIGAVVYSLNQKPKNLSDYNLPANNPLVENQVANNPNPENTTDSTGLCKTVADCAPGAASCVNGKCSQYDEHGCVSDGGFSWCEAKQKCLQPWVEKCEAAPAATTVNWKTYVNAGCGYSFKYPNSWSQSGNESNAINLQGSVMSRIVDFMDIASLGVETHDGNNNQIYAPKDHMHIECYTMGNVIYNDQLSRYNNSQDIFAQNKKTITVAGQTAIVGEMKNTAAVSSGEHPGRTIIPSHNIYVFFMHKDQSRSLYFEFDTPLGNSDVTEIANFEQLLKTFQFIDN